MRLPRAQVDIFSFGVILFEMFAKSVTGAALLTVGDVDECEMYAWKVETSHTIPAQAHPCSSLTPPAARLGTCQRKPQCLCHPHGNCRV